MEVDQITIQAMTEELAEEQAMEQAETYPECKECKTRKCRDCQLTINAIDGFLANAYSQNE